MQLTLLIFIDLFHTSGFEDGVSSLGGVGMQEGAVIQVYSAEVNFILWNVIDGQPVCLFGHLGTILGKLSQEKYIYMTATLKPLMSDNNFEKIKLKNTFSFRASSFSSFNRFLIFSRRRWRCAMANSANV